MSTTIRRGRPCIPYLAEPYHTYYYNRLGKTPLEVFQSILECRLRHPKIHKNKHCKCGRYRCVLSFQSYFNSKWLVDSVILNLLLVLLGVCQHTCLIPISRTSRRVPVPLCRSTLHKLAFANRSYCHVLT